MPSTLLKESVNQYAITLFSTYLQSYTTRVLKKLPSMLSKFGFYGDLTKLKAEIASQFMRFIEELRTGEDTPDVFVFKIRQEIERLLSILQNERQKAERSASKRYLFSFTTAEDEREISEDESIIGESAEMGEEGDSSKVVDARLERSLKLFDIYIQLTKSFYTEYQHRGRMLAETPSEEQNSDHLLILKIYLVDYLVINGLNNLSSLPMQVAYGKRLGKEIVHYRNSALAGNKARLVRDWLASVDRIMESGMEGSGPPGSINYKGAVLKIAEHISNYEAVVRSESKFSASLPLMVYGYTVCKIPIEHEPGGGEFVKLMDMAVGRIKALPSTNHTTPNVAMVLSGSESATEAAGGLPPEATTSPKLRTSHLLI